MVKIGDSDKIKLKEIIGQYIQDSRDLKAVLSYIETYVLLGLSKQEPKEDIVVIKKPRLCEVESMDKREIQYADGSKEESTYITFKSFVVDPKELLSEW